MTISTNKSILAMFASAALLITMAASSPALAMNNTTFGTGKTKADLEKDGWTCVVVATGFWECTKAGEKKQWCDVSSCGDAPMRTGPKPKVPGAVLRNGTLLNRG